MIMLEEKVEELKMEYAMLIANAKASGIRENKLHKFEQYMENKFALLDSKVLTRKERENSSAEEPNLATATAPISVEVMSAVRSFMAKIEKYKLHKVSDKKLSRIEAADRRLRERMKGAEGTKFFQGYINYIEEALPNIKAA